MLSTPIDGHCAAAAENHGAAGDGALRLFPPGKGHSRGGGEQRWSRASGGGGGESDGGKNRATDYDAAYFQSYAHLGIHEEMIKDSVRTDTYRAAIFHYQQYIAGKVVVDVGCGTGILAIFCAQAGARRVYAMDASDIAVQANEIVMANNLSDKVIVLHGRVEDVEIDEKVDVIISEWMGYMLLYESMLGSVVTARDRWLKPGGLILPSHATLLMAPITHPDRYSQSIDFWNEVYGINMSAMIPLAKQCAFEEPSVELINGENVMTWAEVTVLYLYEPIDLEQDVIEGSVTLSQSKENRRFMNIRIQYATGGRSFVKESVMR